MQESKVTVQRETVNQCVRDICPLLEKHWEEVALYRDRIDLDPDFTRYRMLEDAGGLVILTARMGGKLIGYSVFVVSDHMHYQSCKVASNDVLFVSFEYRHTTTTGLRLIRESEKTLKSLGVNRVLWHIKPKNDWSLILRHRGYDQEEIIMGKLL